MAFLFCLGNTLSADETKTLRLAIFLLEPYMMENPVTGEPGGITVDYWREYIAPRMGYELEVVGLFPVNRVERMLEMGEVDVAPLFTRIPSREERFLYPETPLTEITSCLILSPDSPLREVTQSEDLFDMRIGFLEGGYVPPLLQHPRISLELVASEDYRKLNLNKLFAGRLDAALDINYLSLMYYLKDRGLTDRVRILMLPVEKVNVYSIFRKTPEGDQLREQYDSINRQGQADGVFDSIAEGYFQEP